jgi:Flp pilus assembly protein TadD
VAPGTVPIVAFRSGPHSPPQSERERDLGLALGRLSFVLPPGPRADLATQALERLSPSLSRWPGDTPARIAIASVHRLRGDQNDWLREAQLAVEHGPSSDAAQAELIAAATAAGQFRVAEDYATRQIASNPTSTEPLLSRAIVFSRQRLWERVEADCRAALSIDPLHPHARLYLGVALHRQGKVDEGRLEAERAGRMAIDAEQRAGFLDWYRDMTR